MLMRCARPTVTAKFEAFEMWGFYVLLGNTSMDRIPGTDGFRKIRWEDARRGKGERGGLESSTTVSQALTRSDYSRFMERTR